MKYYSLVTHAFIEDHYHYCVECIEGEDNLKTELEDLKTDIITNQEQYKDLVDLEVVEVDENGDPIEFDVWFWGDQKDYPKFMAQNNKDAGY